MAQQRGLKFHTPLCSEVTLFDPAYYILQHFTVKHSLKLHSLKAPESQCRVCKPRGPTKVFRGALRKYVFALSYSGRKTTSVHFWEGPTRAEEPSMTHFIAVTRALAAPLELESVFGYRLDWLSGGSTAERYFATGGRMLTSQDR